jgi:hypothetical protein
MRTYVGVTGLLFLLIAITHIVRAFLEQGLVHDPGFIVLTIMAVLVAIWAGSLLRKQSPSRPLDEKL